LLLAYIGHGISADKDFYLLPKNADRFALGVEGAFHLNQEIKELYRRFSAIHGLLVILDTCHSGDAVTDAGHRLIGELQGQLRLDYLSSTDQHEAYDCNFTKYLSGLLEDGIISGPTEIRCKDVQEAAENSHASQVPFNLAFNPDSSLFIAHNAVSRLPWANSKYAFRIAELLNYFTPINALREIVDLSQRSRLTAILGGPGTGKSTIMAALAFPQRAGPLVPRNFVQASIFLDESSKPYEVAADITNQLRRGIGAPFEKAWDQCKRKGANDPFEREVLGPLRMVPPTDHLRVAIDA